MFYRFVILFLSAVSYCNAQNIIPFPNQYFEVPGKIAIPEVVTIYSGEVEFEEIIPVVKQTAEDYYAIKFRKVMDDPFILLLKNPEIKDKEAYKILIEPKQVRIEAGYSQGCFYGIQSLLQLMSAAREEGQLQCAVIEDKPRYGWRGIMLDESRHFFGMEQVKQLLELMSIHKLNVFHWHLTDVPGWRVEIKKYPLLTSIGGIGNQSDRNAPASFYTQDEIIEIVDFARKRFIEVVPEIDMPGHATSAVRAYPEFNGGGSERHPNFTFNPGKEGTYAFLSDILKEIADLFPSPYIHIGGDEVHFGNEQWNSLEEVQELMKNENLKNLVEVEHYFLHRMTDSIIQMGKTVMGWDEVITAGLPKDHTRVMWWRHDRPYLLEQALEKNYQVVLCPRIPHYFDFVQHESHECGRKWGGNFAPLKSVYEFPDKKYTGGISADNDLIMGMQGNVWTERIHTPERLQFMVYPRLSGLSEAAWTNESRKNFTEFQVRLEQILSILDKKGITYFDIKNLNPKEVKGPER